MPRDESGLPLTRRYPPVWELVLRDLDNAAVDSGLLADFQDLVRQKATGHPIAVTDEDPALDQALDCVGYLKRDLFARQQRGQNVELLSRLYDRQMEVVYGLLIQRREDAVARG